MKVKVSHAPEPVPKKHEAKLPPASEHEDGGSDGDDDSDGSWDEASVIDGHAWWETGSNDDEVRLLFGSALLSSPPRPPLLVFNISPVRWKPQ